jgi:hypothetical protein
MGSNQRLADHDQRGGLVADGSGQVLSQVHDRQQADAADLDDGDYLGPRWMSAPASTM